MKTFLAVLVLFAFAMLAMAVGVLFGGKRLKGSCGGLGAVLNADGEQVCGICGKDVATIDPGSCEEPSLTVRTSS